MKRIGRRDFVKSSMAASVALAFSGCATTAPPSSRVRGANDAKVSVCKPASKLIFACSGCVDVGEISDRAARKLTRDGIGRMFCLAGIGGRVEPIMSRTKSASKILAIDGCDMDCVRNCLQQAGFDNFQHVRITDMGMEKGKSAATDQRIADVAEKAEDLLN